MDKSTPDRSQLLRTRLPRELGEKIRSAGERLAGERRHVTVLFADIAGFTSMSEQLDPEETTELVNRCLTLLCESIYTYEGTVDKFLGDAVMALFGAPVAHEDDPERALRAALDMRERIQQLNHDLADRNQKPLALHIGINSGMVVAGGVGSDLRMDYTVMGDTVNLAARLEDASASGQILASENTYRLTRHAFEFGKLAKLQVKGKAQPVVAYELSKPLSQPEVIRRTAMGYRPLVGRNPEVQTLAELLDLVTKRQGQVVAVVGEAGVGKSRLVFELVKQAKERGSLVAQGDCESFEVTQAFQVFKPVLRGIFGLNPDLDPEATKQELRATLAGLHPDLAEQTPYLGALLDLPDEQLSQLLDAERQSRIKGALKILLHHLGRTRNILLVFDDLQWADALSLELLDYLVENIPSLPVLVAMVHRPGFTHRWAGKTYFSQISLRPLASEYEQQLVENLLPGAPPELGSLISTRAEGNPFYVEEIIKSGLETGAVRRVGDTWSLNKDVELPGSIHGLIMARIDRLEERAKSLLQTASVIGREFSVSILAQVTEKLDELDRRLTELETMELVYEKQILPELEYLFKHYLTQEVAYQSILVKKRKELHRQVAQAIEEVYRDKLEQHYERLAYHYERAKDYKRAADYFQKAAGKVRDMYSDDESEKLAAKGEESLTRLYESRFHVPTAYWLLWAAFCAAMAVGFQVGLRKYLEDIRLIGGSPERGSIWFYWAFTIIFLLFVASLPLALYLSRLQHYVIHLDGVRLAIGRKVSTDLLFSNIQQARVARWWQAFTQFASGFSGAHRTGLLILLKEKVPYSFFFGGGARLIWTEPDNPEAFLKELNRAWNRWRLVHGEGQTDSKSGSSTPASNTPRAA